MRGREPAEIRRSRRRRLALVVAGACASPPAPPTSASVVPSPQPVKPVWAEATPCRYGLGAAELPVVLPRANEPTLLANSADASVVYGLGDVVLAVRLRADGRPDESSRVDLSHSLAGAGGIVALASGARGDAFWWAGESRFLQSRSINVGAGPLAPGPLLDVQRPDRFLAKYRVAPTRDGWVAAWLEDRTDTLAVARFKDGALAWSARVGGVGNTYFVRLGAVGVVGDQIFVLLGTERPRLVRFDLEGARLDDVAFPLSEAPVLESSITERGIVAIARDGKTDKHCVHRVAFDGTSLGQPVCAKLGSEIDEADPGLRGSPPALVWSGDTLYWAYGEQNESLRLRRWRCE